jgi:hypothetical protein
LQFLVIPDVVDSLIETLLLTRLAYFQVRQIEIFERGRQMALPLRSYWRESSRNWRPVYSVGGHPMSPPTIVLSHFLWNPLDEGPGGLEPQLQNEIDRRIAAAASTSHTSGPRSSLHS